MGKNSKPLNTFVVGSFAKTVKNGLNVQETVNAWFKQFVENFELNDSFHYQVIMEKYEAEKALPEKERSDVFKYNGKFITLKKAYLTPAVDAFESDTRTLENHGIYGYKVVEKKKETKQNKSNTSDK